MASARRIACILVTGGWRIGDQELVALAEACLRFSPHVSIRPGEGIFLEVGASRLLFSEESLRQRMKVLALRMLQAGSTGLSVRVAIGCSPAEALLQARYPDYERSRNLRDLPLRALMDYVSPFRWEADQAERLDRMICLLESLGIRDVGGFTALPRTSLASRFGRESVRVAASVWGEYETPWSGFKPKDRIVERAEVSDPEVYGLFMELEGCVFVLRGLVDRAMARLRGRGERVLSVEIHLQPDGRLLRIDLPLPQGSASGLVPLIKEKLAGEFSRRPLRGPVEKVRFEILESVPAAGMQRDFFLRKEEDQEAWEGVVARIAQKIGKERVFVAQLVERYLPEKAYLRKLVSVPPVIAGFSRSDCVVASLVKSESRSVRRVSEVVEWPRRPVRMLRSPERLCKEGRTLRVLRNGSRWKVVSWEGPDRVSGEWWKDASFDGFSRDYYQVVVEGGEVLWIYLESGAEEVIYLHGYFD